MTTRVGLYPSQYTAYGSPRPYTHAIHVPTSTSVYSSAHLQRPLLVPTNPYWKNPHGSSVEVLNALLPHDPNGPLIYYFYVATQEGFSLLLYHSKLEDSFMRSFLSGCDPLGARVDPLIMEARYQRVPFELFQSLAHRFHHVEGLPPHIAVQGEWLSTDYRFQRDPSGIELSRLLYGYSREESFTRFNLKLVPNTWEPIVHNQELKGVSFAHAGKEELTVWLHESNSQALGSALKVAKKNSRKLKQLVARHEDALQAVNQFKDGKLKLDKLLQRLFKALPYTKPLIQAFRSDPTQMSVLDQIVRNANEYLGSVQAEKKKVDAELVQLIAFKNKADELLRAQVGSAEAKRLQRELDLLPCPNSCAESTAQIRKQKALTNTERKFFLRKNLIDTLQLLRCYHKFLPEFNPEQTKDWLERGKQLLIAKANWIFQDQRSRIILDPYGFRKDLNHHFGSGSTSSWEQFEWLFHRFAEYEANFQMVRIAPFIDQDVTWLMESVKVLENLLKQSGRLTYDLETEQANLAAQRELLLDSGPIFLVKRPEVGGEIKSVIVRRFGVDPLETRDGVHIPIGK